MTAIDLNQKYSSTMDSVNLINARYDAGVNTDDQETLNEIERNKDHLKIMVAKDFWTDDYDLQPFHDAIARTE